MRRRLSHSQVQPLWLAVSFNISTRLLHVAWASSKHGRWVPRDVLVSDPASLSVHYIYRGSHKILLHLKRGGKQTLPLGEVVARLWKGRWSKILLEPLLENTICQSYNLPSYDFILTSLYPVLVIFILV